MKQIYTISNFDGPSSILETCYGQQRVMGQCSNLVQQKKFSMMFMRKMPGLGNKFRGWIITHVISAFSHVGKIHL